MANAARQLTGFNPRSQSNPEIGSGKSDNSALQPGQEGYLQAFLDSARERSRNTPGDGETTIAQSSGDLFSNDLFTGPDTADFNQPTLKQQASHFGDAQPLDPQAWTEQADQKPTNPFADALRSANGTKTNPEQSPVANPLAEQAPKPATLTQVELVTEMNEARKAIDAQQLKAKRAELAQVVQEAKRATIQLKNSAPALRNAALGLENNQHNAGVGKSSFAHQLAILASRVFARQENLAQLAREELAAKNAKKNQGGAEAGMPAKGPEATAYIQRTINTDNEQSGQNAGA